MRRGDFTQDKSSSTTRAVGIVFAGEARDSARLAPDRRWTCPTQTIPREGNDPQRLRSALNRRESGTFPQSIGPHDTQHIPSASDGKKSRWRARCSTTCTNPGAFSGP